MDLMYNDLYCMNEDEIEVMPSNPMLAHAYVPFQIAKCLYNPAKGLRAGTIFPELNMPYMHNREMPDCGCRRNDYE